MYTTWSLWPLQCLYTIRTMWSTTVCFENLSIRVHHRVFIHSEKCGPPQCVCPVWAVWAPTASVHSLNTGLLQWMPTAWALWFTTASVHSLSSVVHYRECPQPEQYDPLHQVYTAWAVWTKYLPFPLMHFNNHTRIVWYTLYFPHTYVQTYTEEHLQL